MTSTNVFKTAIEISKILGISDRTITRWAVKGLIEKRGKAEYCLISVFSHYENLLSEQIIDLSEKIKAATDTTGKHSLKELLMKESIRIITSNAKIKQHELEKLENSLVDAEDAKLVYQQACGEFRNQAMELTNLADTIAEMTDPNALTHLLEVKVNQLLASISVDS